VNEGRAKLAYPIEEAFTLIGVPKSSGYLLINAGEISTFKVGRRRMISARALHDFIDKKEREASGRRAATA